MTVNQILTASALYGVPKITDYLTTEPSDLDHRVAGVFDKFRRLLFEIYKKIAYEMIGEEKWEAFVTGFVENTWISYLAIAVLSSHISLLRCDRVQYVSLLVGANTVIFASRLGLSSIAGRYNRTIADRIAPRFFPLDRTVRNPIIAQALSRMNNEENTVPEMFHDHPLFSKHVCAITGESMVDQVLDPTAGGKVMYSRAAIVGKDTCDLSCNSQAFISFAA